MAPEPFFQGAAGQATTHHRSFATYLLKWEKYFWVSIGRPCSMGIKNALL